MLRFLLAATPIVLAACSGPAMERDPMSATGEVIALSGGSAGARNACVSCHGLRGEGDGALAPRLAGLDQGYLARQLTFYVDGQRSHPQMVAIAKALKPEEREKVAAHYARLPATGSCPGPSHPDAARLYAEGDASRGLPSCRSCHGTAGEGDKGNPPLAGQPAPYLERQLKDWREGNRYGDPLGAMTNLAKLLKVAELAALSAHASALPGGLNYRGSLEGCPPARRAGPRNGA